MTDSKADSKSGDVSHKRKFDKGEEQSAPKRSRLEELQEEEAKLMARRAEIDKIEEDLIRPHQEAIDNIKAAHKAKYHDELEAIKAEESANEDKQDVESMRETLLGLIEEAKEHPDKCFLFDDRVFNNEDLKWQPIRDLVNEQLEGFYEARGYFGLEATESQIACNWNYEDLEWMAEQQDRYYNDPDNIVQVPVNSGQPGFYLDEICNIEIKDAKTEIDTSFCGDLEWDDTAPDKDDIDWETDKSCVEVFGKVFVPLAIYTLRKGPEKCVYD